MPEATPSSAALVSPRRARGSDYLATLDGWRAIAIIAVIFSHANLLSVGMLSDRWLYDYGYFGVDVFFSISGLLICWRLMQEERLQGRISLRNFYIRRGFRILPAAFAFLLVLAALTFGHVIRLGLMEWVGSAFFFRNYTSLLGNLTVYPYFTSHFWSLSIEEHFYLFLPALLVFTQKRLRVPVLLLLTLAIVGHRYFALRHSSFILIDHHTDIRLDSLLFPAMLAILVQPPQNRDLFRRFLKLWPVLAVLSLVIAPWQNGTFWKFSLVVVLFSLTVLGSVLNPDNLVGRLLESSPLRFVGKISYSLYLWQQLFFTGHFFSQYPLGLLNHFPLQLIATFVCAVASYYWLEKPMIQIGHRLARPSLSHDVTAPRGRVELLLRSGVDEV